MQFVCCRRKGMISSHSEEICCGKLEYVRIAIGRFVLRPRERGLKRVFVLQSRKPAMLL